MNIKFGLASFLQQTSTEAGKAAGQAGAAQRQSGGANNTESVVSLSPLGAAANAAQSRLAEQPIEDEARVQQMTRAIAEGRYTVQPERVAEAFLKFELALEGVA